MGHYLVAGAAGFIASRVCEMLLELGHTVTGVDSLNTSYDVRMKQWRLKRLQGLKNFDFFKQDICDKAALFSIVGRSLSADAVINLAARAGVRHSVEDPWSFVDTNVTGTLNLLELCRRLSIPKFILASSSSVYGANAPLPTSEDVDTSHPIQPYAATKIGAEVMCHAYHYLHNMDVTVFRFFNVFGPGNRPDMAMFRFIQAIIENRPIQLFGDGSQTRGFTFLDDITRGVLAGLKPLGYEIINLGGHEIISMNDLIQRIEKLTRQKAIIQQHAANKADMQANYANVEKARTLLDWQPEVSFDEGLHQTVDWYLRERSWTSQIQAE